MILITCLLIPGHLANSPPERKRVYTLYFMEHTDGKRKKGGRWERRRDGGRESGWEDGRKEGRKGRQGLKHAPSRALIPL